MCGIVGWVDHRAGTDRATLAAMCGAIAHRGPDGQGTFFATAQNDSVEIALGHVRLAIIDLATGDQPMRSEDGRVTLVFNGEIYNYLGLRDELQGLGFTFRTSSDTEVLLQAYRAWGPDCVRRFRGMFAFALWDGAEERLVLARDPFGKKPLYLWNEGPRLVFGSEAKAILAHPRFQPRLDCQSVADYLLYRYVPGPNTLFKGVVKLDPGCFAVWQEGRFSIHRYYVPPDGVYQPPPAGDDKASVDAFAAMLDECVRLRMAADVPFGAFLSGGIDSSAIVALMSKHSNMPINTFSIGFKEADYSELGFARSVARQFRTNHTEIQVSADDIMTLLPKMIAFRDAPVAETADVPIYMLSAEAARTVKMVLTGEGADEILGGYPKHRFEPYVQTYQAIMPDILHRWLVDPLAESLPYGYSRVRTLARSFGVRDAKDRMPRWFGALTRAERDRALADRSIVQRRIDERPFQVVDGQTPLRRILYFDQTSWLPDNLLERGDRMTMAGSIEARMPFMDHELAALVNRMPDSVRIRGGEQKWILREMMRGHLPAEILDRPKNGFRVPVNLWFATSLRAYVHDLLLGADSYTRDFFRPGFLTRIFDQHVEGRRNHEKLLWSLLSLELFQRRYRLV